MSNPPATVAKGASFNVTDSTGNGGTGPAAASVTRYYLSTDAVLNSGDRLLPQSRNVPALASGASSTGTVTVTVPLATTSGTYRLLACADNTSLVAEGNQTNNCTAAPGSVTVS